MKMKLWILSICLLGSCTAFGQSFQAFQKAADKAFEQKDYYAVLHYCRGALARKPNAIETWYTYARAAQHFYAYEEAAKGYKKVAALDKGKKFPDVDYQLALVYKGMGDYATALTHFNAYRVMAEEENMDTLEAHIKACQAAMQSEEAPAYSVTPLSKRLNSAYSEFGAWRQGDTLYYSSYRFENKEDKARPKRKIAKVLYAKGNGRGRPLRYLNTDTLHTAHTAISLDGQRLYYTQCRYKEEGEIQCALYYRKKDRRKRWGRKAFRLPKHINTPQFTNTQPTIGFDSLQQKEVLYFVSDRPEGAGGLDIWWSVVEASENKFSDPKLYPGNTPQDEITPFVSTAEQRLYFSADYAEGWGGFDIYQGPLGGASSFQRSPLPKPINSSYNDIYFFLDDALQKKGLFSSNRPGQRYLDPLSKACCNDIYTFALIPPLDTIASEAKDSIPLDPSLSLEPLPKPNAKEAPDEQVEPLPVPSTLADFLPLALYFENDHPDPRTRRSRTKLDYLSTFDPYLEAEETYVENYLKLYPANEKEQARSKMQQFFEREVAFGGDRLILFSNLLLRRLEEGDKVEIFVKGYTSPRAQSDYNLQLGKRRVSSLINHFNSFQAGVFRPYLQRKELIISERSFGESTAAKSISDDISDRQRSVYSIDAARERRVEIVEVKRN
ncbi:MAG: hypothetical protein KTR30_21860 [Saprospiraceae bacterium]|nr:hypothetical protein [Saprospiraceae bacterium]